MKVLVIDGAPRRSGFTRELTGLFGEGVRAAGAELEIVHLAERDVRPCTGCLSCFSRGSAGRCVQRDDMDQLIESFLASDALVLATPVYFFSLSALLKAFVERLLPVTKPGIAAGAVTGLASNVLRHPDRGPRAAVLIAVAALRGLRPFEGLTASFDLIAEGLGAEPAGHLLRPESYFLDFAADKVITQRRVRAAFERAGLELVRDGRVSPKTAADACAPLTDDDETFGARYATYWEIAHEIGAGVGDRKKLRAIVANDLRILVPELAHNLDPRAAAGITAKIAFELDGDPQRGWHLAIEGGACTAVPAPCPAADLTLRLTSALLADVILQRVDMRRALADNRIEVAGSTSLLQRFGKLFRPPKG